MKKNMSSFLLSAALVGCLSLLAYSQTTRPASRPASDSSNSSAAAVVDRMMKKMKPNKLIEPVTHPARQNQQKPELSTRPRIEVDAKVLGVAPGMPRPKLRREGEFVINRRGRLMRANDGKSMLFIFKSDSRHAPEPPMILVPCQLLQNMEEMMLQRGDQIPFSLTGQILTYHGANYLLPTMMKPAIDMGNLEN